MDNSPPHIPSKPTPQVMEAFQALEAGNANEFQQKTALKWLIYDACRTYDLSYRPNDTYATTFAEGRRAVGLEIITLLKLNVTAVRSNMEENKK